jgi:hypothetical protein
MLQISDRNGNFDVPIMDVGSNRRRRTAMPGYFDEKPPHDG